ncbi:MAG: hypothetical protein MJ237_05970 [bacterium]|nr:hypothetical protein [bacterium]
MAKAIPHQLNAYTSWGTLCTHENYPSKNKARKQGKWLVEHDFAFSYTLTKLSN